MYLCLGSGVCTARGINGKSRYSYTYILYRPQLPSYCIAHIQSTPTPAPPKLPLTFPSSACPWPKPTSSGPASNTTAVPAANPPIINRHPRHHKARHNERLPRLRENSTTQQKQTDTAENNRGANPGAIRALEMGFFDAQDDQSQDGDEIEAVARDAVEGDEGTEFADEDVEGAEEGVE